jgi:hypothetical protein
MNHWCDEPGEIHRSDQIRQKIEAIMKIAYGESVSGTMECEAPIRRMVAEAVRSRKQWTPGEIHRLAGFMGSVRPNLSRDAAKAFLSLYFSAHDDFAEYIAQRLCCPVPKVSRKKIASGSRRVLSKASAQGPARIVRAFRGGKGDVPVARILSWIKQHGIRWRSLLDSPRFQINVCLLVGEESMHAGTWLEISPSNHLFLIGADLPKQEKVAAVVHELLHLAVESFGVEERSLKHDPDCSACQREEREEILPSPAIQQRWRQPFSFIRCRREESPHHFSITGDNTMNPGSSSNIVTHNEAPGLSLPFAMQQEQMYRREKHLAGEWAVNHILHHNGGGVIYDAGSSCMAAWNSLLVRIREGHVRFMKVFTNNYRILGSFAEHYHEPFVPETHLSLVGTRFDAEHLAFYGPEAKEKFSDSNFRPSVVYIGVSSIEFDGNRVFFGYHGPEAERDIKELFLTCFTRHRVILATPRKIGCVDGDALDLLSLPYAQPAAPIHLVTTAPGQDADLDTVNRFNQAKERFQSESMQRAFTAHNLQMRWIILDPSNGDVAKELEVLEAPGDLYKFKPTLQTN